MQLLFFASLTSAQWGKKLAWAGTAGLLWAVLAGWAELLKNGGLETREMCRVDMDTDRSNE